MILKARKSLGQHFLTSHGVVKSIVTAARVENTDRILEIGPGKGILTKHLLESAAEVIAVEKDTRMVELLKEKFSSEIGKGVLTIIEGDILSTPLRQIITPSQKYKVVANIPYYITGELLRLFLSGSHQPISMTILVQKEVAARIAREKKESLLSLSVKAYGVPRYVQTVRAGSFVPKPKVDSAILTIENISKSLFVDVTEEHFFAVVKQGFSQKRKKLLSNLRTFAPKEKIELIFQELGISLNERAENISVERWVKIAKQLP